MDERFDIYKLINKKIIGKISKKINTDSPNILIIYDFLSDFIDCKDNKIRIGISGLSEKKIKGLMTKVYEVTKIKKFNIIDLRMTMKYLASEEEIESLFNFFGEYLEKNGYIIGLVNSSYDVVKNLNTNNAIDKFDEIWCPEIGLNNDDIVSNIVIYKKDNIYDEQVQTMINFDNMKIILKKYGFNIKCIVPLNSFLKIKTDINFDGEYMMIIKKID